MGVPDSRWPGARHGAEVLAKRAEWNRQYRARQKRETLFDDLDKLFKAQRERVAKTLKAHTDRVAAARWKGPETDGYFAVTRSGSTEVSRPVKREYQEQ